MKTTLGLFGLVSAVALSACDTPKRDKTIDRGFDSKSLSELTAGIWVDPNGCEHWIIDDGVEGYADLRRTPDGKPVCNSDLPPNSVSGPFKAGSAFSDAI